MYVGAMCKVTPFCICYHLLQHIGDEMSVVFHWAPRHLGVHMFQMTRQLCEGKVSVPPTQGLQKEPSSSLCFANLLEKDSRFVVQMVQFVTFCTQNAPEISACPSFCGLFKSCTVYKLGPAVSLSGFLFLFAFGKESIPSIVTVSRGLSHKYF